MIGLLAQKNISLPRLMAVVIPSTFIAVLVGALSVAWRGKELGDDPVYQARLASGQITAPQQTANVQSAQIRNARGSTLLFLLGIAVVVLLGIFPKMRPVYQTVTNGEVDSDQVGMGRQPGLLGPVRQDHFYLGQWLAHFELGVHAGSPTERHDLAHQRHPLGEDGVLGGGFGGGVVAEVDALEEAREA